MGKKLKQLLEELREIRNKYLAQQEEVEKQLLELCDSQEKELLRQKEKDSQVQEDLQALSRKLDRMIDKMEGQDKNFEQLNRYLKQQNESQNEELARCKGFLEHLTKEKHRLEEEKKDLEEGACKLEEEKKNLEGEIRGLEEEKKELEEEKKELEEEKKHLEQKALSLKMEPEIETGRNLYQRYKVWPGKEQLALTELASESFFEFLCNCSSEGQIEYIFNRIATNLVWEGADQEGIEIMNEIIDYCIAMQNKNGKKLHRQEVKEGDEYNYRLHQKMGDAPNQGYVERIRLPGVEQNGKIYEDCRAFVDITNH